MVSPRQPRVVLSHPPRSKTASIHGSSWCGSGANFLAEAKGVQKSQCRGVQVSPRKSHAREEQAEHRPGSRTAPIDQTAVRAGVGNATLYRRFPNRETLILQVVLDTLASVHAFRTDGCRVPHRGAAPHSRTAPAPDQ